MNRPVDTRQRVHLALSNLDMLSLAVGKAVADGAAVEDIVVLLLDTRDVVARDLAAAILARSSDLDLGAEEARVLRRDEIPTGIAVISVHPAKALFETTHPSIAKGLGLRPPMGHVRVVAITEGGATLLHLPLATLSVVGTA